MNKELEKSLELFKKKMIEKIFENIPVEYRQQIMKCTIPYEREYLVMESKLEYNPRKLIFLEKVNHLVKTTRTSSIEIVYGEDEVYSSGFCRAYEFKPGQLKIGGYPVSYQKDFICKYGDQILKNFELALKKKNKELKEEKRKEREKRKREKEYAIKDDKQEKQCAEKILSWLE